MNLTWHIIKKDLRALRWPLGLWLLCIASKLMIGVILLRATGAEGPEWFQRMDAIAKSLSVGELLSFVLVAALIQEDLMVGTTAFWMTRPISGARLLLAKLLCIGLVFIAAPVLLTLPWWLGCHYGAGEIAWAAAETVAVHAIAVLAALLWAAVTDGLGRFLMWTLITLFTTPMLTAIFTYYVRRKATVTVPELVSTRLLVALVIIVTGILVMLVHQYLTRRAWRSIAVIGVTMGLAILTLAFWPWAWRLEPKLYGYLIHRVQGNWSASAEPPGLKFTLASAEFAARRDRPDRPGMLNTRFRVDGLTDSQGFMAYNSENTWRWRDGTTEPGYSAMRLALNNLAWRKALAAVTKPESDGPPVEPLSVASLVSAKAMERIRQQAPAFSVQARLRLMQYESTTTVPLQPGIREFNGVSGERLAAVEKSGEQLLVTFIRHVPSLWVDIVGGGWLAPEGKFVRYFLVNPVNGHVDGGATQDNIQSTRIATVEITWQTLAFRATSKGGGRKPLLEAINALDDAKLVKVSFSEQARFIHELQLDAAQVAAANP